MKHGAKEMQAPALSSATKNIADFADIYSALKLLGIDRDDFVRIMDTINDLPVHLWVHDENHAIVYGNSCFMDTGGDLMKQSCHQCLMGEKNVCECCLSKKCLASNTTERCTLCRRNNFGYDINIFHTPVTNAEGKKFIIKTSHHIAENGDQAKRLAAQKKGGAGKTLFLVMCAACSRVKDKNNNWVSMDFLGVAHPNIRISHGICPECTNILYPGLTNEARHDKQDGE